MDNCPVGRYAPEPYGSAIPTGSTSPAAADSRRADLMHTVPMPAPRRTKAHSHGAMYAAARLYYEEDLTQHEIAKRLRVSRTTVVRLLQLARETGIVRIEVRSPTSEAELAEQLTAALGLRRAVVVPALRTGAELHGLTEPALAELARLDLEPGEVLAVGWGQTMWELARAQGFPELAGVRVVPAIGALNETDARYQSNEIARRVADTAGAEADLLPVPALPSPRLRRSLLADPDIAARLALWDNLAAAIVGVGLPPAEVTTAPAHVNTYRDRLTAAVGDVASRHFDIDGNPVALPDEDRLLGVSRAQLRAARTVIAVAAGPAKAQSIVGAARAKLITVLVTDTITATTTLEATEATS
jgi:DNA-binding transcriptional regulator LsrR (DeoR family)